MLGTGCLLLSMDQSSVCAWGLLPYLPGGVCSASLMNARSPAFAKAPSERFLIESLYLSLYFSPCSPFTFGGLFGLLRMLVICFQRSRRKIGLTLRRPGEVGRRRAGCVVQGRTRVHTVCGHLFVRCPVRCAGSTDCFDVLILSVASRTCTPLSESTSSTNNAPTLDLYSLLAS